MSDLFAHLSETIRTLNPTYNGTGLKSTLRSDFYDELTHVKQLPDSSNHIEIFLTNAIKHHRPLGQPIDFAHCIALLQLIATIQEKPKIAKILYQRRTKDIVVLDECAKAAISICITLLQMPANKWNTKSISTCCAALQPTKKKSIYADYLRDLTRLIKALSRKNPDINWEKETFSFPVTQEPVGFNEYVQVSIQPHLSSLSANDQDPETTPMVRTGAILKQIGEIYSAKGKPPLALIKGYACLLFTPREASPSLVQQCIVAIIDAIAQDKIDEAGGYLKTITGPANALAQVSDHAEAEQGEAEMDPMPDNAGDILQRMQRDITLAQETLNHATAALKGQLNEADWQAFISQHPYADMLTGLRLEEKNAEMSRIDEEILKQWQAELTSPWRTPSTLDTTNPELPLVKKETQLKEEKSWQELLLMC